MKKLYGRGSNWTKMTTTKLNEILNHPHCIGSDGKDYFPYKEELQSELWRRQAYEGEIEIKRIELNFKKLLKEKSA